MTCFCGGEGSDDVGRTSKDLLQFQSNFQSRHLNTLIWVPKQIVTKMLKDKGIIQFCDGKLTYFFVGRSHPRLCDIQFCRIALVDALQRSAFLRTFGGCLPFPHPPPPPPPPPPTSPSPPPPAFPLHAVLPVVQCQHQLIIFAAADRCLFSGEKNNFSPMFPR